MTGTTPPPWPLPEALAQRIADSLPEGLVVYDQELRCRLWNPFMEKITGHAAAEVLGRRVTEEPGFLNERGMEARLQRVLSGHAGFLADTAYSQKRTNWSGHLGGTLTPLRNEGGVIVGAMATIHDITRRKRVEEAHLAHEQRYRQLFEENPQPMWLHDVETLAFLAVNEAALRHYGYTRQEFLFLTINDVLAPADLLAAAPEGTELRGNVDEARLWRHRTKDGRVLDVEINSQVVNFGGRRAVLVVANDVTEKRRALQVLRENELKDRTLIEAADVAIFLSDAATGRILEANRRAEDLLGLPRHKIVGLHLRELSPPEMADSRPQAPARPGWHRSVSSSRAYVWHRAGRRIPVDIITGRIEVSGRKCLQSIYRDITERKRAEEALARRSQQLEALSRATRQMHAVLEVPAIFRALVQGALELIGATGGMAGRLQAGRLVFLEYLSHGSVLAVHHPFEPGQGVAGYVMSSKLTYSSNDPAHDPLVIPQMQATYKLHNLVCVPILGHQGELRGCLEVHNTENRRPIDDTDLTMLEVLAATAATALENAQDLAQHAALLEAVPDAILVVDENGRMVSYNENFVRLWHIPPPVLEARQDDQALECVLQQLQDPQGFLAKVKHLYATPLAESHDHIHFKDGRVFERFSRPRRVAGQVAGRVWSFRDVTATFAAKAARRQEHARRVSAASARRPPHKPK